MNTMRLPDFMIIGAAKSATTSLHGVLGNHPDVWMSSPKEPTFFSNPEMHARGMSWYGSLFEGASENQLCGEASTTYMRWPFAEAPNDRDPWPDIAELDKALRFIYMVRHPVDRAYSHYGHHMRTGCTMSFEDALQKNSIYVDTSRYSKQLEHFRSHLPDAPLLVLEFGDFKNNQARCFQQVFDFLDIRHHTPDDSVETHENRKGPEHYISHTAKKIPILWQARQLLPRRMRS
ncbi:MAG: sulfotransferase, partial [Phycisphaerales bacterium]|nr:sulfotransferase [Phycisphaerales bacterium]